MLILDKILFIHIPKTGGTFVKQQCLRMMKLQSRMAFVQRLKEKIIPGYKERDLREELKHPNHLPIYLIPPKIISEKTVFANTRNPFSLVSSRYFWARRNNEAWAKAQGDTLSGWIYNETRLQRAIHKRKTWGEAPSDIIPRRQSQPHLINFNGGVNYWIPAGVSYSDIAKHNLGQHAHNIILQLAPDPAAIFKLEPQAFNQYFLNREFQSWLDKIRFIHTENLSQELYDFLLKQGYSEKPLSSILNSKHTGATKNSNIDSSKLWTKELRQFYYDRSWIIFELFPEYKTDLAGIKTKTS